MKSPIRLAQQGFTLIELLIVAIMLAILAAIVIPQFSGTTEGAQEAALRSDLAGIRSAIALYRQEHGAYPGAVAATGATCTAGTASSGDIGTELAMLDQLGLYTNAAGEACNLPVGTDFNLGPYLDQQSLPTNPVTNSNTLVIVAANSSAAGDLTMGGDALGAGWKYDLTSGKFIANDTGNDNGGVAFDTY
jgi:prepilin-type N-terminal cleavage/methylation domain-containing protein